MVKTRRDMLLEVGHGLGAVSQKCKGRDKEFLTKLHNAQ